MSQEDLIAAVEGLALEENGIGGGEGPPAALDEGSGAEADGGAGLNGYPTQTATAEAEGGWGACPVNFPELDDSAWFRSVAPANCRQKPWGFTPTQA